MIKTVGVKEVDTVLHYWHKRGIRTTFRGLRFIYELFIIDHKFERTDESLCLPAPLAHPTPSWPLIFPFPDVMDSHLSSRLDWPRRTKQTLIGRKFLCQDVGTFRESGSVLVSQPATGLNPILLNREQIKRSQSWLTTQWHGPKVVHTRVRPCSLGGLCGTQRDGLRPVGWTDTTLCHNIVLTVRVPRGRMRRKVGHPNTPRRVVRVLSTLL